MSLEADAGTILEIAGNAGGGDGGSATNENGGMRIKGDAGGGDCDYGESGTISSDYPASTSVVETPAAMVANAMAAKTAEWVWRPTPGPFRKSRGAFMALVPQLPQLQPLGKALAEMQFFVGPDKKKKS
jgi:hypothetical protein